MSAKCVVVVRTRSRVERVARLSDIGLPPDFRKRGRVRVRQRLKPGQIGIGHVLAVAVRQQSTLPIVCRVREVLAGVGHLCLVVAPDIEDVFGVAVHVHVPFDPRKGVVDVVDVLSFRFACGRAAVIRILRGVGRGEIDVDSTRSECRIEVREEILVSVDIDPNLGGDATTVGRVAILPPEGVRVL